MAHRWNKGERLRRTVDRAVEQYAEDIGVELRRLSEQEQHHNGVLVGQVAAGSIVFSSWGIDTLRGTATPYNAHERPAWLLINGDVRHGHTLGGTFALMTLPPSNDEGLQNCTPLYRTYHAQPVGLLCDWCDHTSPGDAAFCIECGADFRGLTQEQRQQASRPHTGPTRRLR